MCLQMTQRTPVKMATYPIFRLRRHLLATGEYPTHGQRHVKVSVGRLRCSAEGEGDGKGDAQQEQRSVYSNS